MKEREETITAPAKPDIEIAPTAPTAPTEPTILPVPKTPFSPSIEPETTPKG